VTVEYEAWGRFKVAEDGMIDPKRDEPIQGTWTGVDSEALIWSATKAPDGLDQLPFNVLEVQLSSPTAPALPSARLDRYYLDPKVVMTAVPSEARIVAEFYSLPDAVRRPAVITFGGSEGGITSARYDAMYLASKGYPSLALAYFGASGLPLSLGNIQLETWDRAYQWLSARPEVDPEKGGVMGGSRGGEAALAVGASFAWVRGVVAQVPSGVSWAGPQLGWEDSPTWSLAGVGRPFLPTAEADPLFTTDPDGIELVHYRNTFEVAMQQASPEQIEAATFRVENTQGRILILAGADDQVWPSCDLGQLAWGRLPESHRIQYQDEYWCLTDAGHSFPTPGSPTVGTHRAADPNPRAARARRGWRTSGFRRCSSRCSGPAFASRALSFRSGPMSSRRSSRHDG